MTDELQPAAPAAIGIPDGELRAVADGTHSGPHSILGQHLQEGERTIIRARRPLAERVTAILATSGERVELQHLAHGIWQGAHDLGLDDYRIETVYGDGVPHTVDDPYRFLPVVGEVDQFLFGEGRHERLWHVFGAHHLEHWGTHAPVWGTSFVVWAPHAQAVRVIGSFNGWDGRAHTMRRLDALGIWELFVPGVAPHETYKFQIRTASGDWVEKADPMALHAEQPPQTASVVATPSKYEWGDDDWMGERAQKDPHTGPMTTYELHAMSWRPGLGYRELADQLVEYLDGLEFTHVEFMPLAEHPFGGSWGYQVTGYYAPTSRLGSPDDLRYLIDRLHQAGYGVIMDWVPGHFPKDSFGLAEFDGQALYEHADPRLGEQLDWGTKVFNFGDSQVRNFLVANALYWLEEFHIDGLRVDAVASILYLDYSREEWVPNIHGGRENLEAIAFLQEVNATAYKLYPGIAMIAEESTSWAGVTKPTEWGGLGFGLKWNMGWMNDSLRYVERDPIYRSHHQGDLTFSFVYAWSERFLLPISHDEVVHGKGSLYSKMPGDEWQKLAGTRLFLAYQWGHPGKQLLFMGQEFAQQTEWSESRGLDWWQLDNPGHAGVQRLVGDLNRLAKNEGALWQRDDDPSGMVWLSGDDAANSVLAFARRGHDGTPDVAMVFNFSNQVISGYRLGLPHAGRWSEVLNTDAETYAGSGAGNYGAVTTDGVPSHGFEQSAAVTVPPLAAVWFKYEG
ncbi:1,4-alpha-glucan branching enzyme [Pseudoclavibacter sp. AY1F1]|uniref:1,4-alpha-glucan branching protein GlgB n=1 Tax=Pseudoclavibacter sp. AY1F1 TaxID=2080583 RepID=UPI000CE7DF1A|nr:1,4-alpha-glucan branching protein GlgB [Pseudoclavibacter sp. AY1F1]PPF46135.1 1,4-alpha-glucan branching enzyme [Pseudoclavibacter sp. AY1F1]